MPFPASVTSSKYYYGIKNNAIKLIAEKLNDNDCVVHCEDFRLYAIFEDGDFVEEEENDDYSVGFQHFGREEDENIICLSIKIPSKSTIDNYKTGTDYQNEYYLINNKGEVFEFKHKYRRFFPDYQEGEKVYFLNEKDPNFLKDYMANFFDKTGQNFSKFVSYIRAFAPSERREKIETYSISGKFNKTNIPNEMIPSLLKFINDEDAFEDGSFFRSVFPYYNESDFLQRKNNLEAFKNIFGEKLVAYFDKYQFFTIKKLADNLDAFIEQRIIGQKKYNVIPAKAVRGLYTFEMNKYSTLSKIWLPFGSDGGINKQLQERIFEKIKNPRSADSANQGPTMILRLSEIDKKELERDGYEFKNDAIRYFKVTGYNPNGSFEDLYGTLKVDSDGTSTLFKNNPTRLADVREFNKKFVDAEIKVSQIVQSQTLGHCYPFHKDPADDSFCDPLQNYYGNQVEPEFLSDQEVSENESEEGSDIELGFG